MFDFFKRKKRITTILNGILPFLYPYARIENDVIKTDLFHDEELVIFMYAVNNYFCCNIFKITKPEEVGFILIGVLDSFFPGRGEFILSNFIVTHINDKQFIAKVKNHSIEYMDFLAFTFDNINNEIVTSDKLRNLTIRKFLDKLKNPGIEPEKEIIKVEPQKEESPKKHAPENIKEAVSISNPFPEKVIKVMCVANEYLFQKSLVDEGFEFVSQHLKENANKHYDVLKFKKTTNGKDIYRELYFDISAFFGKNQEIIPKFLDMPPANKPLDINAFLKLSDDFYSTCKAELGFDLRDYTLTFKQYSSEMVGGHIANLFIKEKTILVSPVRTYHEKSTPILHGYFMMRLMIDHQVQHLLDSYEATDTETPLKSDYYKPLVGIDCVQFTPLPGYNFCEDLLNYTLFTHTPRAFENTSELRAFKASLQVAFQYNLFNSSEMISVIKRANLPENTAHLLINAVGDLEDTPEEDIDTEAPPLNDHEIQVPRDGSLRDALEMVPSNGIIRISIGEHQIDEVLSILKPISIIGDGKGSIIYSALENVFLDVNHKGEFRLSNLTIKGKGSMLNVDCGSLHIEGNDFIKCYDDNMKHYDNVIKPKTITPPTVKDDDEDEDIGFFLGDCCPDNNDGTFCLTVKGNTTGTIINNVFTGNNVSISFKDNSDILTINNKIHKSSGSGVHFENSSKGRFEGNTVSNSESCGIYVADQSSPEIIDNVIENNSGGISYWGESSGTAERNMCRENKGGYNESGISVQGKATPKLLRNTCVQNGLYGIKYCSDASGVAEENICKENFVGISLCNSAAPKLVHNECSQSTDVYGSGICYVHDSSGLAEGNICSGNDYGIKLDDKAHPELKNNDCQGSKVAVGHNDDELEYINSFYVNTNKYLRSSKSSNTIISTSKPTPSSKSLLKKYMQKMNKNSGSPETY